MIEDTEEYQDILISKMEQGVDKSTHISKIREERWSHLVNVWNRRGLKKRRPGLLEFGNNLPLNGAVMGVWQIV